VRIIAGILKGRRLAAPPGRGVRPTSDGLRETLFNVLGDLVAGTAVVDAFAGTGAIGLEAYSRGAIHVTFIERDPKVARVLEQNIRACGLEPGPPGQDPCVIIRDDFLRARVTAAPAALVFADPPYDIASLDDVVRRSEAWLTDGGRLVLEHSKRRASPEGAASLRRTRVLTSGDSALSFYER